MSSVTGSLGGTVMTELNPEAACQALVECIFQGDQRALEQIVDDLVDSGLKLVDELEPAARAAIASGRVEIASALLRIWGFSEIRIQDKLADRMLSLTAFALRAGQGRVAVQFFLAGCGLEGVMVDKAHWQVAAEDLMQDPQLDLLDLDFLLEAARQHRSVFAHAAVKASRVDIVRHVVRTDPFLNVPMQAGSYAPVLREAVRSGDVPLVRALSAATSVFCARDRDGETVLHEVLRQHYRDETQRSGIAYELLRHGAVPEIRDASGRDALALAQERGLHEAHSLLQEYGHRFGPRQSREARAAGVRDICLRYDKADGFIYRIGDPAGIFYCGGDYDGAMPCDAQGALQALQRVGAYRDLDVSWFVPFLQLLAKGQEFSYSDIAKFEGHYSTYSYADNPNWGR